MKEAENMTYKEAREYIQTVSKTGSVLGLESIRNLMHELSDVQETLSVIHIAGTNGKGSTGTYLSAALMEAGYQVGRYTSPAVFSPLEVWQINGTNITEEEYANMVSQVKNACDILVSKGLPHPTVFEVETAMAFLWFSQKKCDYVLLETGMGGSTDATNVITKPICSVLTSISMDHMQFLGNSLEEIAEAKAGIIKKGCPVVTVKQKPDAMEVIEETAKKLDAKLLVADPGKAKILESSATGNVFCFPMFDLMQEEGNAEECQASNLQEQETLIEGEEYLKNTEWISISNRKLEEIKRTVETKNLEELQKIERIKRREKGTAQTESLCKIRTRMAGIYQIENAMLAVTVLHEVLHLPQETIKRGIEQAVWPGRFEVLSQNPLFIADGAHNEDAAEKLYETVSGLFWDKPVTYMIGVLADKEHKKILAKMLPLAQHVFTVTPPNVRALDAQVLAQEVRECVRENCVMEQACEPTCMPIENKIFGNLPMQETDKQDENMKEVSCRNVNITVESCDSVKEAVEKAKMAAGKAGVVIAFGSLSYLGYVKEYFL